MVTFRYFILVVAIFGYCHAHSNHAHTPPPAGTPTPNSFHDKNMVHNEQHLKEHMQNEVNTDKQMTPEEMEFNYFRLHDTNQDSHLDGLEILAALSHMLPPPELTPQEASGKKKEEIDAIMQARQEAMFNNYVQIIDKVLMEDDKDQNGYLSYAEYQLARRRDEQRMREAQKNMTPEQVMQQQQMMQQQMQQQQQMIQQQQQQMMMMQQQQEQQQQQQQQGQGQGSVVNMNQPGVVQPPQN
ncbi:putative uncharacterized protein DDB_G0271606 [Patella vulgata]|uniref:putative uncharacterized protein DDB_G0271606 n=1 Tax=Patella vulgata TaxID=6465 RepID=UPI00217FA033|nr:putative uncharacterized protein DDB_G0271606 [Patella vulgata]